LTAEIERLGARLSVFGAFNLDFTAAPGSTKEDAARAINAVLDNGERLKQFEPCPFNDASCPFDLKTPCPVCGDLGDGDGESNCVDLRR
jgi:hypothetical protein